MREFTDDVLNGISDKLKVTKKHSFYYKCLYNEFKSSRFKTRFERVESCLDFWLWDKYEVNELLNLKKVNRCMDRFCPNCRSVAISRAISNFEIPFKTMLDKGYSPYFMTLTVPNVSGQELKKTIQLLGQRFTKFWRWINQPLESGYGGSKKRLFHAPAAIRMLEITIQENNSNMYHPHFHLMVFLKDEDSNDFQKYIPGPFRRKSNDYLLYSNADIHIMKLWKLAWDNIRITNYDSIPDEWWNTDLQSPNFYQCDIRPLEMPTGIYEVFKYTFKDTDIRHYDNFKTIFNALDGKRLRQGHGELYNVELEFEDDTLDDRDCIENYLENDKKETPQEVITRTIEELTTVYKNYRKLSLFKGAEHIDNIS